MSSVALQLLLPLLMRSVDFLDSILHCYEPCIYQQTVACPGLTNAMVSLQRASELFAMAAADAPTDARTWLNWALLERRRDHYGPARR